MEVELCGRSVSFRLLLIEVGGATRFAVRTATDEEHLCEGAEHLISLLFEACVNHFFGLEREIDTPTH